MALLQQRRCCLQECKLSMQDLLTPVSHRSHGSCVQKSPAGVPELTVHVLRRNIEVERTAQQRCSRPFGTIIGNEGVLAIWFPSYIICTGFY